MITIKKIFKRHSANADLVKEIYRDIHELQQELIHDFQFDEEYDNDRNVIKSTMTNDDKYQIEKLEKSIADKVKIIELIGR
jgi:hypothetical protein